MNDITDESQSPPCNFTPIQSRRFRTSIPCWSLCPSMDLLALGSGSAKNDDGSTSDVKAADSVTIYRLVSWQRLLFLTNAELTSHSESKDDVDWDLAEDGCINRTDRASDHSTEMDQDDIQGATAITWSPDGRLIAIGLRDGNVLIHSVESSKDDEGEEMLCPLHIIRTAYITVQNETGDGKEKRPEPNKIALSPRITRSMAAQRGQKKETVNEETFMDTAENDTHQHESTFSAAIIGLTWKRVAPRHSSWSLTSSEWEKRESWRYASQLINRGNKFLPNECYVESIAGGPSNLFSPLAHLNVLCVATENELHWYLQSRYRILSNSLNFTSRQSITKVNVVLSPDASTVFCIAEHSGGAREVSSEVKVFTCPLLASKRFDLQILAASYRSIFSRLKSVKHGMQSALSSWGSALRPLDMKFQRLFQLFCNYNVATAPYEVGSAAYSIREELLRFILSGRSTVVGDASNALDQFFTRADMHDQLLLREASGIKASLGSIESKLRLGAQSDIRAIVYETEELYGIIKTHQVTAADSILLEAEMALKLYKSSRILSLTFERFMSHVVAARCRVNDLLSWIRGTATEIRARGTAPDSILRQHARDRRPCHDAVCRVTDFLSSPIISPHRGVSNPNVDQRKLTECIIGITLSDNLSDCKLEDYSEREPTLHSALLQTVHISSGLFDRPRSVFSESLHGIDIAFGTCHSLIALHTRIGAGCDDALGDGYFSPQTREHLSLLSPYWVIIARTVDLQSMHTLEIIAIPSHALDPTGEMVTGIKPFCLQAHLDVDDGYEIISMGFYSDDGNSTLSPNLDIDADSNEGRQSLGLVVKNEVHEELWKFHYDSVLFDLCDVTMTKQRILIDTNLNESTYPVLSTVGEEDAGTNLKRRMICTRDDNLHKSRPQLGLCGSRGTGGVLTFGPSNSLEIFDLEEDEDDDSDVVVDDID